jgi:predicted SAM-dependent methyltransferase
MNDTTTENPGLLDVTGTDRLHIGGREKKDGWKILNIQPGEAVDYVGDIRDLSSFPRNSFDVVYASHVLEHVSYRHEINAALRWIRRILRPGGKFFVSVPDLDTLCRLFIHEQTTREVRFKVMRMMFGGQTDPHDFHQCGLTAEFLGDYLLAAGFKEVQRVPEFGFFGDTSSLRLNGVLVSLNMVAVK